MESQRNTAAACCSSVDLDVSGEGVGFAGVQVEQLIQLVAVDSEGTHTAICFVRSRYRSGVPIGTAVFRAAVSHQFDTGLCGISAGCEKVIRLAVLCIHGVGRGTAAEDASFGAVRRIGTDGSPHTVKHLEGQVIVGGVGCLVPAVVAVDRQQMRALVAVQLRAIAPIAALVDIFVDIFGLAVIIVVAEFNAVVCFGVVSAKELVAAPEAVIDSEIGILRGSPAGILDSCQIGIIGADRFTQQGNASGIFTVGAVIVTFRDDCRKEVAVVTKQQNLLGRAVLVLPINRCDFMRTARGGFPIAGCVGFAVVAIIQRIAVSVPHLGQVAVGENFLVAVFIGQRILCAGTGDFQAGVFALLNVAVVAAAVNIIVLRSVAVRIDQCAGGQGHDRFLQGQLPADADLHGVEIGGMHILVIAGKIAAVQTGVIHQRRGKRQRVARLADQRHDQRGLHGKVADVCRARIADGGGLIGVVGFNAAHVAILDHDARAIPVHFRTIEARARGNAAFVCGNQCKAEVRLVQPIVPFCCAVAIIPACCKRRDIPFDVVLFCCVTDRLAVNKLCVMCCRVVVIDISPCQVTRPFFPNFGRGKTVDRVSVFICTGQRVKPNVHGVPAGEGCLVNTKGDLGQLAACGQIRKSVDVKIAAGVSGIIAFTDAKLAVCRCGTTIVNRCGADIIVACCRFGHRGVEEDGIGAAGVVHPARVGSDGEKPAIVGFLQLVRRGIRDFVVGID